MVREQAPHENVDRRGKVIAPLHSALPLGVRCKNSFLSPIGMSKSPTSSYAQPCQTLFQCSATHITVKFKRICGESRFYHHQRLDWNYTERTYRKGRIEDQVRMHGQMWAVLLLTQEWKDESNLGNPVPCMRDDPMRSDIVLSYSVRGNSNLPRHI